MNQTSILGVDPGTPIENWSDEQIESMMDQICRETSSRERLSSVKKDRLVPLEIEWARRKQLTNYKYIH